MDRQNKKPGIIVLGGHVQALNIIRILGRTGVPAIIIDSTYRNLARHSKFCHNFYKIPDKDLSSFIFKLKEENKYPKWFIFPTNDFHVNILSKNKELLEPYFNIAADSWNVTEKCYNKRLTYEIASSLNIPIPKTWMPDSLDEIEFDKINFPCIVKPAVMHTFYKQSGKKVFLSKTEEELKSNYQKAINIVPANEIIIQEVIPGDNYHQYSACFLFDGSKSLLSLTARRARQHPLDFGNATTYAEIIEDSRIVNYAEQILKEINYHGLCEVEFKFDTRDAKYKFFEINPRTWKWHSIAAKARIPFLVSYYNKFFGIEVNRQALQYMEN